MRPCTKHFVVTTKDCIAVGGHFYSALAFNDTMMAMIVEHFAGDVVTNNQHSKSPLILFKLAEHYRSTMKTTKETPKGVHNFAKIKTKNKTSHSRLAHERFAYTGILPSHYQMACLVMIVLHADQLVPYLPRSSPDKLWHAEESFKKDFEQAVIIAKELCVMFREREEDKDETDEDKRTFLKAMRYVKGEFCEMAKLAKKRARKGEDGPKGVRIAQYVRKFVQETKEFAGDLDSQDIEEEENEEEEDEEDETEDDS